MQLGGPCEFPLTCLAAVAHLSCLKKKCVFFCTLSVKPDMLFWNCGAFIIIVIENSSPSYEVMFLCFVPVTCKTYAKLSTLFFNDN